MTQKLRSTTPVLDSDLDERTLRVVRDRAGTPHADQLSVVVAAAARIRAEFDFDATLAGGENDVLALRPALGAIFERILPSVKSDLRWMVTGDGPRSIVLSGLIRPQDRRAAQAAALGVSFLTGLDPYQFKQQNGGEVAAVLKPVFGAPPASSSSRLAFGPHTDDPNFSSPHRVRFILLCGYLNEQRVPTGFASLDKILRALSSETIRVLFDRVFEHRVPPSIGMDGEEKWTAPRAILSRRRDGRTQIAYDAAGTKATTAEGAAALKDLDEAAEAAMDWFVLDPGTMMIFENAGGLHARRAFDGNREVVRVYLSDLAAWRETEPGVLGRVFDARTVA